MDDKTAALTEQIRTEARRRLDGARNNKDLSAEKRTKVIARAYLDEKRQLEKVLADTTAKTSQRRSALERKIYGLPDRADASSMISYRDALDRAAKLGDDHNSQTAATALLNRAQTSGDTLLARAILATAYEKQWVNVINHHISVTPAVDAEANELWDLTTADTAGFVEQLHFVPVKPRELDRYSDLTLEVVAADEPASESVLTYE